MFAEEPIRKLSTEICASSDACYMDALEAEQYDTESLDERMVSQLETINFAAAAWTMIGKNVSTFIEQNRQEYELYDVQNGAARNDRRVSDRNRESVMGQKVSHAHNAAVNAIGTGLLEGVYVENLVVSSAPPIEALAGLEDTLLEMHNLKMKDMGADRTFAVEEELTAAFQCEFLVRASMQVINQESPQTLQTVFDPSSLLDLPIDLQRIAALDINRGIGASVLLDNAAKYAPGEQPRSAQLADYIKANNLPENVKKSLSAIKLGMQAMGAPSCPFNDLGVCTHLLAKIPQSQFPEEIQRDIANRDSSEAQRRMTSLVAFAKRNAVSKILDSSIQLNESFASNSAQSKKRTSAPKLEKRDFIMVENPEVDAPTFTEIKFRFANSPEIVATSTNVTEDFEEAAKAIFEQKIVKKYIDTYHDQKLEDMLFNALGIIAILPTYIGTNRMITPWLDMKHKAHINEEGVKERFMRYSGARSVGVSGGPVGKDTRVIFSQGTEQGVRHITIHKILHKSDIKSNVAL